jgi:hypothetical protein
LKTFSIRWQKPLPNSCGIDRKYLEELGQKMDGRKSLYSASAFLSSSVTGTAQTTPAKRLSYLLTLFVQGLPSGWEVSFLPELHQFGFGSLPIISITSFWLSVTFPDVIRPQ